MLTVWQRRYYYYFNSVSFIVTSWGEQLIHLLFRDSLSFSTYWWWKRIPVMFVSLTSVNIIPLPPTSLSWQHRPNSWFPRCSGIGCHLQDTDYMKKIILAMFFFLCGCKYITKMCHSNPKGIFFTINYL